MAYKAACLLYNSVNDEPYYKVVTVEKDLCRNPKSDYEVLSLLTPEERKYCDRIEFYTDYKVDKTAIHFDNFTEAVTSGLLTFRNDEYLISATPSTCLQFAEWYYLLLSSLSEEQRANLTSFISDKFTFRIQ